MTTNGVLMTEEKAEYCIHSRIQFMFSIDGDEKHIMNIENQKMVEDP